MENSRRFEVLKNEDGTFVITKDEKPLFQSVPAQDLEYRLSEQGFSSEMYTHILRALQKSKRVTVEVAVRLY